MLLAWQPDTLAHRVACDRWVLQLLCGRRYEDMAGLDLRPRVPLHLPDGTVVPALNYVQGKTTSDTVVPLPPLPPLAVRLGERYGWQLPPASNRDRNQLIREVACLALPLLAQFRGEALGCGRGGLAGSGNARFGLLEALLLGQLRYFRAQRGQPFALLLVEQVQAGHPLAPARRLGDDGGQAGRYVTCWPSLPRLLANLQ